jgi:hypothetical protein
MSDKPKESEQLFNGAKSLVVLIPKAMNISDAYLHIDYGIDTGKEHESIAPIFLDYDPLERIKTLESAMQEFIKSPGLPNRHLQIFKDLLENNETN